jgi:hypothetical protein
MRVDARRFAVVTRTAAAGAKRAVRVDLSLPVRLAGLAPGALLELQLLPQDEGGLLAEAELSAKVCKLNAALGVLIGVFPN